MNRMEALLPTHGTLWEPAGAGRNAQRSDRYGAWYADGIHSFLPGTWVIAGHRYDKENILKLLEAVRRVWTERSAFHQNDYWLGEDAICTEWSSTNGVWNGRRCRNSGRAVWKFRDNRVVYWRNYLDICFYAEVHAGWREAIGPALGRDLPNWPEPSLPLYPDPMAHE
jgi:hypothetical protein